MVGLLYEVDPGMATQVAEAIGVEAGPAERPINRSIPANADEGSVQPVEVPMKLKRSAALSQAGQKLSIRSLKIALLAADGFDEHLVGMKQGLEKAGAMVKVIGPAMGDMTGGRDTLEADLRFKNQHSVLYDAIHVCGGDKAVETFRNLPEVKEYVMDAWMHCKAISMGPGAEVLLREWNIIPVEDANWPDGIVAGLKGDKATRSFIDAIEHGRYFEREQPVSLSANKRMK
jgi:catalase